MTQHELLQERARKQIDGETPELGIKLESKLDH